MSEHYKIDLYTDAVLAEQTIAVGDVLPLEVPDETGIAGTRHKVTGIETSDAGSDPKSGEHLNRVVLTLEDDPSEPLTPA